MKGREQSLRKAAVNRLAGEEVALELAQELEKEATQRSREGQTGDSTSKSPELGNGAICLENRGNSAADLREKGTRVTGKQPELGLSGK